jgi:hypothetical protein
VTTRPTSIQDKIKEREKLLKSISPRPWFLVTKRSPSGIPFTEVESNAAQPLLKRDKAFVAAAPEFERELIQYVRRLEEQVENLKAIKDRLDKDPERKQSPSERIKEIIDDEIGGTTVPDSIRAAVEIRSIIKYLNELKEEFLKGSQGN